MVIYKRKKFEEINVANHAASGNSQEKPSRATFYYWEIKPAAIFARRPLTISLQINRAYM